MILSLDASAVMLVLLIGYTSLMGSGIRSLTHCSVVALRDTDGEMHINPDPGHVFEEGEEMYLIGDSQAEKAFYEKFGQDSALTD